MGDYQHHMDLVMRFNFTSAEDDSSPAIQTAKFYTKKPTLRKRKGEKLHGPLQKIDHPLHDLTSLLQTLASHPPKLHQHAVGIFCFSKPFGLHIWNIE